MRAALGSFRARLVRCDRSGHEDEQANIFAAGEITGIGGSTLALQEGTLAGIGAAEAIGAIGADAARQRRHEPQRRRDRLAIFADMLSRLFAPRDGLWEGLADDTIVCRCEEVIAGDLRTAIRAGCASAKAVKDWTRAGMGLCQGRMCRAMVAQLIAQERGIDPAEHRVPARPAADQASADRGARRDRVARHHGGRTVIEIGVDIGGTFTDVVLLRDQQLVTQTKVPTTPADPILGVQHGVQRVLDAAGMRPAEVDRFVHGSTVAINALLQRKGAVTGVLATEGFEDTLEIGRQKRSRMYELMLEPETPTFLGSASSPPRHRRTDRGRRDRAQAAAGR